MTVLFKTSVAAALSLILGAGALTCKATPINVTEAKISLLDELQISPNTGTNLHINGADANLMPDFAPIAAESFDDSASLNSHATVKYSGSELKDAILNWNAESVGGNISASSGSGRNDEKSSESSFAVTQSVSEVRAPLAAWQSITGLLFVIVFTAMRLPKPATK